MGQYFRIGNLEKREYLEPWDLGSGAKAWEQAMSPPAKLLLVLLGTGMGRGGGDFEPVEGVTGRWAGDSIVFVGDYAEDTDMPEIPQYGNLYYHMSEDGSGWTNISDLLDGIAEREF